MSKNYSNFVAVMKRVMIMIAGLVWMIGMPAEAGTVVRDTINGVPCRVYVPGNGRLENGEWRLENGKKYPVLYLQHGMWGNEDDWVDKGRIVAIMDSLVALKEIDERVVVMPDNCPSKPTFEEEKKNATNGEWEANFATFMAEAEAKYPIEADKETRAVAGLSMGGYHSMRVAHVLDGEFAYVGMFSPATFVHNYSSSAKVYWIAIGREDFLYLSVKDYRKWLDKNEMKYTYYETSGGHEWRNWQDYIVRFLKEIKANGGNGRLENGDWRLENGGNGRLEIEDCRLENRKKLPIEVRVSGRVGAIMPDGKVDVTVGDKGSWVMPVVGGDIAVAFRPDWQALKDWNDASVGAALSYYWLGHEMLGHAVAPYAFMDIPLVKRPHFVWGLRPGVGFALITKTYGNTVPEGHEYIDLENSNRSVGSVFNCYLPEAMYFDFPIKDGWSIGMALGWYHMSNGSIKQPNSGYNFFAAEVNAKCDLNQESSRVLPTERKSHAGQESKAWEVEIGATGGGRQVYYRDQATFFCSAIQAAAYWRAHRIFRLGGGVDVFYDGAYKDRETRFGKTYLKGATEADCWRVGVSLQPEFVAGRFTAGFHFGVYLYDPIKNREAESGTEEHRQLWEEGKLLNKGVFYGYDLINAGSAGYPDGWLYTQIMLRYRLPWHMMIQAQMKAHLTKVEFVGLGLGAWF